MPIVLYWFGHFSSIDIMGFGKDGKGAIIRENVTITVGGLAAVAVIKGTSLSISEDFRILKTEYFISQSGNWGAVGDEVIIGFADDELSVGEIAECLNVDGPVDRNDRLAEERVMRAVWSLIDLKGDSTTVVMQPPNDGKFMEHKPRWTFSNPEGWTWFAYNPLSGALTAGAVFIINAKYFGVWVT